MTRESLLIVFGFLTLLSPFFGLPSSWLTRIDVLLGLCVAGIAYTLKKNTQLPVNETKTHPL